MGEFLRQMNMQRVAFLNLWGMVVYVAVAAVCDRYTAHNRVKLRAHHTQNPRSRKTPSLHPSLNLHYNHSLSKLNLGDSPRHSRSPNSLNHPKMDSARRGHNALPRIWTSTKNTAVNARLINPGMHISSLQVYGFDSSPCKMHGAAIIRLVLFKYL